ncbi:ROK family protein [Youngiibacter multivorans]|uniref:NBD/HSP70 family sugar kinase n=1 Tax=Youngiibacter multivorans TaxID=937251 RepID=A0ABS4G3G9_9CLOT|nr:ROK family protein [Youngiibacter multivorans]MBP1919092.1 putative NBD/HSP70 family sugar kinase [Youngiibacter multivorans]
MVSISGNSFVIREINTNLVRNVLKSGGQYTKQQIAASTGLTSVTAATVLNQLIASNEAIEVELSSPRGGRPAHQFKYNPDHAHALVLFPVEAKSNVRIRCTVVNLFGETVSRNDFKVPYLEIPILEEIIDEIIMSYPKISAIGLGLPGAEHEGKIIVSDYKSLIGLPLVEHLRIRYQRPVIMENDVNSAVIGYSEKELGNDKASVAYIYFPGTYPPGSGLLLNGRLLKGDSNFAGEVSFIPLGIDWTDKELYSSQEKTSDAVAKLIATVASILNPRDFVLNGDFLTKGQLERIHEKCMALLPEKVNPRLHLSDDFNRDYLNGMIHLTLNAIEPGVVLSRGGF